MGQSWWHCEDNVWGSVGGIVKNVCGADLLGLLRMFWGQSWWNCEDGVWVKFGGMVKTVCGAE